MIRLLVTAEGQAERNYVTTVLAPHLAHFDVYAYSRCVLTSKDNRTSRQYRGGLLSYQKAKADILTWMKEDQATECRFTTMFDLYALPDAFPGYENAKAAADPYTRIRLLEDAFYDDIGSDAFVPYIQLHEFEALVLADPKKLDWEYIEHEIPIHNIVMMVGDQNPELINDSYTTAPSKRITSEIEDYDKANAGVSVVAKIGLPTLRARCRHFDEWIPKLEDLGRQ